MIMKRAVSLLVWWLAAASLASAKQYIFCSDSYKLEPDLGDVIDVLTGSNISRILKSTSWSDHSIYETVPELIVGATTTALSPFTKRVLAQEIPILKVISDGVFTINWKSVNFDDVFLLKQNHFFANFLCSLPGSNLEIIQSRLCSCWTGNYASGKALGLIPKESSWDRSYCSSRPCADSKIALGDCHVTVDPFTQTCIQIFSKDSLPENTVYYNASIPTLENFGNFLVAIVESFQNNIEEISDRPPYSEFFIDFLKLAIEYSKMFFAFAPKYLFNLVVGAYLFNNAESLASSKLFQYALAGSLGLILALAWMTLTIYRMSSRLMKDYIPFPATTFAAGFFALSYSLTGNGMRNLLISSLWSFWDNGSPFGIKWAGKVYFLASFLLSVMFTRIFGLFSPKSASHEVLRYSLKLIALILLINSSSSKELAIAGALFIMFKDDLEYFAWSTYLISSSITATPTRFYTGKQLTMKQYEEEGENFTKKSLAQLQAYLEANPDETNKYMDKFREADKMLEASTLLRFVHHGYGGRPSKNESLMIGRKSKVTQAIKIVLLSLLILSALAITYSASTGGAVIAILLDRLPFKH